MNRSIWDLKPGNRITLDSGAVAEVVAPTRSCPMPPRVFPGPQRHPIVPSAGYRTRKLMDWSTLSATNAVASSETSPGETL